jgi:hypothetical protein
LSSRVLDLDPLAQCVTLEMHAEMWRDEQIVADETHILKMTVYFTHELSLMLERTGFEDVVLRGGYRDAEPTSEDDFVVFIATKPSDG